MNDQSNDVPPPQPPPANPVAAAGKAPTIGAAAPKPPGSSPLKVLIPIVALAAVVFGITLFSQYSDKSSDKSSNDSRAAKAESPLYIYSATRYFQPIPEATRASPNHYFPGFYEPGDVWNSAFFWFENRNPAPVTMQVSRISEHTCRKCVSGRLAPVPPEVADQLLMTSFLSGIPQGPVSFLPLSVACSGANLSPLRLNWQENNFEQVQNPEYKVPSSPEESAYSPFHWPGQWAIFEVLFKVTSVGLPKGPLQIDFSLKVDGAKTTGNHSIVIGYEGVDPFNVSTDLIDIGEWTENKDPHTFEFVVYSSTRGPDQLGPSSRGDLTAPSALVQMPGSHGNPGPFVSVGAPQRLSQAELMGVMIQASQAQKRAIRVESGYLYTVTVNPRSSDSRIDLGPLDREVLLALPGMAEPKQVKIKGLVRGSAWLDGNGHEIKLPSYRAGNGVIQTVKIVTENRDTPVRLIPDESSPKFANYSLNKLPSARDYGYYELKVEIPKNSTTGSWSGVIIVELGGSRPQRLRIPIRGSATL